MKRLITICLVVGMMLAVSGTAQATLWEIQDLGLQDDTNFIALTGWADGTLNSRSDTAGDPGTSFDITLSSGNYDIIIANNFDEPPTGMSSNVIPIGAGGMGDLSSPYTGYTMSIYNPSSTTFNAAVVMNTGWTDTPYGETDRYYQDTSGGTSIVPGATATLILDFSSAAWWSGSEMLSGYSVDNTNHISNIGFKIWVDGQPCPVTLDVGVVPEPATIALLGLGALSLLRRKRRA